MAFTPTNYNENGENGGALSLPALDLNGNSKGNSNGNSNGSSNTTNNIELIESKKKSSNTSTTTMTALDLNIIDTDVTIKNKEQKEELSGLSSSTGSIGSSIGSSMPDNSGTVSGRTSPALNTLSVESYNHKPRQNSRSLLKKSMTDATRLDRVSKIKIANAVPQNVVCNLSFVSL